MSENNSNANSNQLPIDDVLTFNKGDVLFDTSKPSDNAYFILEGSVDLDLTLSNKNVSLTVEANQFIGDAAVVTQQKKNSSEISYHGVATALETVKAVAIPVADIQKELESCSPLLRAWFASFINRVLIVIEKLTTE